MLINSFCHIPLISARTESKLWTAGIHAWGDAARVDQSLLSRRKLENMHRCVEESQVHLPSGNALYFSEHLPSNQHWRLFPEFRHSVAFLDIETTGLGNSGDHITTIALYDGRTISHYIHGENLRQFASDIGRYKLLVTYNGKCFDIPFIENYFGIGVNAAHIDLRYVLRSLGYGGGLKTCEQRMGLERDGLEGVDGFFAVLLWSEYKRRGNVRALETLLAYNIQDVVNLETLMVRAYNLKLRDTPFTGSHVIAPPTPPVLPFEPHMPTIQKVRRATTWY